MRGIFFDRIGDGDDTGRLAVDGDEDRGGAFDALPLGLGFKGASCNVQLAEEPRVAERDALPLDHADRALAGG